MKEIQPPTPKEIDALVLEYEGAQTAAAAAAATLAAANKVAGEVKGRLIEMVEAFGGRHTEKSKRLFGVHTFATTTTATRVAVDPEAVESFREYLGKQEIPELANRFFQTHVTYSLVNGPVEVLRTLDMPKRLRTKITSMLGLCFKIFTNAPSLKVETVKAEPVKE